MPDKFDPAAGSPLTPEEAQAAYDAAPSVPLSDERIDEIVRYATGGGRGNHVELWPDQCEGAG